MGKIKKTCSPKHETTLSPAIKDFAKSTLDLPFYQLPQHLDSFPKQWPFPRGDLYHWINVLNLFDEIMNSFNQIYELETGPQREVFSRRLLTRGDSEVSEDALDSLGFSSEGDRELIESIVDFSRLLVENCGNRSLYASSDNLNHLLNTSSLSLLNKTLQLSLRLAQRYHASRQRSPTNAHSINQTLLQSHFQLDLDRIELLALPFVKNLPDSFSTLLKPAARAREGGIVSTTRDVTVNNPSYARNLVSIVKDEPSEEGNWRSFGGPWVAFNNDPDGSLQQSLMTTSNGSHRSGPTSPLNPSPSSRNLNQGQSHNQRTQSVSATDDPFDGTTASGNSLDISRKPDQGLVQISFDTMAERPITELVAHSYFSIVPKKSQYELFTRMRVARALTESTATRQDIVATRLLAISNLAYIYPEHQLQSKVLKGDSQESKPLQLCSQLCELVHPPKEGKAQVPRHLQTLALTVLESLTKHKNKAAEVCAALNVNVNHGVMFYVIRKFATECGSTTEQNMNGTQDLEWREALFSLLLSLSSNPRTGESMVAAGLVEILSDFLRLRTQKAEWNFSRVLHFLDTFVYQTRDAFQNLVNANGLDQISDLIAFQVDKAVTLAARGEGIPEKYKAEVTDYEISFVQQQTIRALFKFVSHMMSVGGGGFDRLLRNLIESAQLLSTLRSVISNAILFGSNIWSSAINILSNFINSEPTSFAAIAETGTIMALLNAVTQDSNDTVTSASTRNGIPPVAEAICTVPQVFGAVCLNEAGMRMIVETKALQKFFNVLKSRKHILALATAPNEVESSLGAAFDELSRHHPSLKTTIVEEVVGVIANASSAACQAAEANFLGAKIYKKCATGPFMIYGAREDFNNEPMAATVEDSSSATRNQLASPSLAPELEMTDISQNGNLELKDPLDSQPKNVHDMRNLLNLEHEEAAFPIQNYVDVISRFLLGFFSNTAHCTPFAEKHGVEQLLKLITSPALPVSFSYHPNFFQVKRVFQIMVDQKPHLTVPQLINQIQLALDQMHPLVDHPLGTPYYSHFVSIYESRSKQHRTDATQPDRSETRIVKNLLKIWTLCEIFAQTLHPPSGYRTASNAAASLNLADLYISLTQGLGKLQTKCIWEGVHTALDDSAPPQSYIANMDTATLRNESAAPGGDRRNGQFMESMTSETGAKSEARSIDDGERTEEDVWASARSREVGHKNTATLGPLLARLPQTIASLLAALGRSILTKRIPMDSYQKQNVLMVADQIAEVMCDQLFVPDTASRRDLLVCSAFLSPVVKALTDSSTLSIASGPEPPTSHPLTVILQAFKVRGGIEKLGEILKVMLQETVRSHDEDQSTKSAPHHRASDSAASILKVFAQLANHHFIQDATQTQALAARGDRDRDKPDYFSPAQFVVEVRMALMPAVLQAWNSDAINKLGVLHLKFLMQILGDVLDAQGEHGAFKRSENVSPRTKFTRKLKSRNIDSRKRLTEKGFEEALVDEALFRCNDNFNMAQEYCSLYKSSCVPRNPIPSNATAPFDDQPNIELWSGESRNQSAGLHGSGPSVHETAVPDGVDEVQLPSTIVNGIETEHSPALTPAKEDSRALPLPEPSSTVVTVDDLDEQRYAARNTLMERSLDVLAVHENMTFELADLIMAGVTKVADKIAMREEVTETLLQALISFQSDSNFQTRAKKIVAHSHLLGIILQDKDFFQAGQSCLKENFGSLLEFLKVPAALQPGESAIWIGHILLIVERMLAEDSQPELIKWTGPSPESTDNTPVAERESVMVSEDHKAALFLLIMDFLPRIGKDTALGLSAVRVLVILTRDSEIASRLGQKKNLQRLFVMIKQLAGLMEEKLQSAFMLVLRHIIEDPEKIRQIMRSDIRNMFENAPSRPLDTTQYTRQAYHLVLRQPDIFIEVTNELLMLPKYDRNQTPQTLALKRKRSEEEAKEPRIETIMESAEESAESQAGKDDIESGGNVPSEALKMVDGKPPVVDRPDGLVHYLLSELLTYKDVEDKEPTSRNQDKKTPLDSEDVEMGTEQPSRASETSSPDQYQEKKDPKSPAFRPEDHPIYIYRCFILQCLTELLQGYTTTKVDFINFSRKADPQTTPSKPRSGVLNYLLNVLIPTGTLSHAEDMPMRKKSSTSSWAICVIVSLVSRTSELGSAKKRDDLTDEDEPSLAYVRKFVLEHILKAYRDASVSTEPLEIKYSRLLGIADLFNRILSPKSSSSNSRGGDDTFVPSQKQIAKIMFEKHFITALTNSISDVDLNFPGANRVVKYILRPLKLLTNTAIELSMTSDVSNSSGQTDDDDEISSATSLSEAAREETPDLFRNSTLGMFEPRRDDESSSGSSDQDEDEEMYGDDYAEDMDFQEGEHDDEVISDEDEEMGDMGPIEGMPGDMGMEVEIDVDEDTDGSSDDDDDDDDDEDGDEDTDDSDQDNDDGEDDDEDIDIDIEDALDADENGSLDEFAEEDGWQDEPGDPREIPYEDDDPRLPHNMAETSYHAPGIREIQTPSDGEDEAYLDSEAEVLDTIGGPSGAIEVEVEEDGNIEGDSGEDEDDEEDDYDGEGITYGDHEFEEDEESGMPSFFHGFSPHSHFRRYLHHHHQPHHHHRRDSGHLPAFMRGYSHFDRPFLPGPSFRTHRQEGPSRANDDGINPLLHRTSGYGGLPSPLPSSMPTSRDTEALGRAIVEVSGPDGERHSVENSMSYINNLINALGHGSSGTHPLPQGGAIHFTIDGPSVLHHFRDFRGFLSNVQTMGQSNRTPRDDPVQAVSFSPTGTLERWQEEARLLFGPNFAEKTVRVVNMILKLLVPPAIEAEKVRKQKAAEEAKRQQEEIARLQAEQEARVKKELEEKAKAEAEAERLTALEQHRDHASEGPSQSEIPTVAELTAMEGVEPSLSQVPETEAPESRPRVLTDIRGRQIDITDLGIDQTYLEALPEEMREEVIMQQYAEHRSQANAAGEEPTALDQEFLNALPPEIREELVRDEARERRERERQEARRRAAVGDTEAGGHGEEMTAADMLASLDPVLRTTILGELEDEQVLAGLPPGMAAEARASGLGRRRLPDTRMMEEMGRQMRSQIRGMPFPSVLDSNGRPSADRKPRRIVQMLDTPGVAALLRLMFTPVAGNAKNALYGTLLNVCENRQIRVDILSGLLSILQDGSADVAAIERSFAQLTLRAKQVTGPKSPQSAKRALPGHSGGEASPSSVVGQCLSTLAYLTHYSSHMAIFFLTEHEIIFGNSKTKAARKGKTKDVRANKFPINALISLLGRGLVVDNSSLMENLAKLLQVITQPLSVLKRKEKEKLTDSTRSQAENPLAAAEATSDNSQAPTSQIDADAALLDAPSIEQTNSVQSETATNQDEPAISATSVDIARPEGEVKPEQPKKPREMVPPEVPEENLRLIVKVFTARDCSSVTFRDTMSTMNNMSIIPQAKEIFGQELVRQARELGQNIHKDLLDLIGVLKKTDSVTEAQGLALAKFSPASSDQAKLLRVLTALDYLFDQKDSVEKEIEVAKRGSSEDVLTTLYEDSSIGSLWEELSTCLSVTHQSENYFFNIATILLPLIETLMIVCKRVALGDNAIKNINRESANSTPTPEASIKMVFFQFTDRHKKILNDLVRHNPKLMSGTFSVLVKNPTVLEFDNKRNYFNRRLHHRGPDTRHYHHPSLQLNVRREEVFIDSYRSLHYKSADEIKYGKFNIRFSNEEGVDAGGVTREWFQVLARQMFNPDYALFNPVASDRTTFHPNPLSSINPEHLRYMNFIGRIIGKALYEGRVLDCHFSRAVYKRILSKAVSMKDMETIDLDYTKSMQWILDNDITDIITETFSIEVDNFGQTEIVDLIDNGRNIHVTEDNKHDYVRLVVEYRLTGSVTEQVEHFLAGFHDIVPARLISIFDEGELELLISGMPEVDVDDWRNNTDYHQYTATSVQIQWFWRAVRSFDKEERAKLLQFVTGTGKVPLNGFKELEGMNGFTRFSIHKDYGNKDRLPSSHTCFNQLDLPEYDSYEFLRKQLYTAMTTGNEHFGFA